jgi:hypothetical protein
LVVSMVWTPGMEESRPAFRQLAFGVHQCHDWMLTAGSL